MNTHLHVHVHVHCTCKHNHTRTSYLYTETASDGYYYGLLQMISSHIECWTEHLCNSIHVQTHALIVENKINEMCILKAAKQETLNFSSLLSRVHVHVHINHVHMYMYMYIYVHVHVRTCTCVCTHVVGLTSLTKDA